MLSRLLSARDPDSDSRDLALAPAWAAAIADGAYSHTLPPSAKMTTFVTHVLSVPLREWEELHAQCPVRCSIVRGVTFGREG
jgi:hypothetical protein